MGAQVYAELLGLDPSKLPPNLHRFVDFYKKIIDYNRSAVGSPMPEDPRFGDRGSWICQQGKIPSVYR
jgi:hypothetical protein